MSRCRTAALTGLLLASATALSGCEAYHNRLHGGSSTLQGGRIFDVFANARCGHIATMFRPDTVRRARVGIPAILGASYEENRSYVRVTDPLLLTINQNMLQACIQMELGEITSERYTEIIRDNSARYIALTRGLPGSPAPADVVHVANQPLEATGNGERIDEGDVAARSDQVRASLFPGDRLSLDVLATFARAIAAERASLAATESNSARALREAMSTVAASTAAVDEGPYAGSEDGQSVVRTVNERLSAEYVLFGTDEAALSTEDRERLARFLGAQCCDYSIAVYGFADIRGSSAHNLMLARLRVGRVAEFIRTRVPGVTITELGVGEGEWFGASLRDNRIVYIVKVR